MLYRDTARRLVLALKYGDRLEVSRPAAKWMARSAADLLCDDMLVVPVPLHWRRLAARRYNQSALLASSLARETGLACCLDLLQRPLSTPPFKKMDSAARFATMQGAIRVRPKRRQRIVGRPLLLVDDVMTSGATLSAATKACVEAGSGPVCVVTLARAAKDT
ncbi:ComF family protein [Sulfitobacter aestuarii]|uniref:ComF family protein n=1 Tax=Sulfitobacter aestuarii TaxID=2161676 RepID=A0ABW5TZF9_9RHOB